MSRIFISHSTWNNDKAKEVVHWLAHNGWKDIFIDFDPGRGIAAGQRFREALQKAAYRCEVVLALVSQEWLKSNWCKAEVEAARLMGKKAIAALVGIDKRELPPDLIDEQYIDLTGDPDAYCRLREGLKRAGLDPTTFPFESGRRPYPGSPISRKRTLQSSSVATRKSSAGSTKSAGSRAPASRACLSSWAPRDRASRPSCEPVSGRASSEMIWRGCRSRLSGPSAGQSPASMGSPRHSIRS
jgi:hypothetical protein